MRVALRKVGETGRAGSEQFKNYRMEKGFAVKCRRTLFLVIALFLICTGVTLKSAAQETVDGAKPKPVAVKVLEIGKVTDKTVTRAMEKFWKTYDYSVALYIINYGTDREIAHREKLILNSPRRWPEDGPRMTLVRGGLGKGLKTVIWKVPFGADNPEP
jgi:hypothetical protein